MGAAEAPRPPAARHAFARWRALRELEEWLEGPMLVLGFVWLVLLVVELTVGLSPLLAGISTAIWILFLADFLLRFALAPRKLHFLRRNWLVAVSLLLPALRVLRVARAFRALRALRAAPAARGARLVKVVGSVNRGMRALGRTMRRRGAGYAGALTAVVYLAGAAGIYAFEYTPPDGQAGIHSFGDALWWTLMLLTTIGSEYWPRSAEGRLLCVLLALFAIGVFGYLTAALASFFVGRDAASDQGEIAGTRELAALRTEITALRAELRAVLRTARERGPLA